MHFLNATRTKSFSTKLRGSLNRNLQAIETLDTQFRYTSTAVFSVDLVGVLGILQWENARHGALFFASTTDGFSFMENFLHRYFPTIIIVLYGMAFSWIGLDNKRLEPWFQLARNGGAEAEKSVLLQYPVDFLSFVPFKAAKLRSVMLLSLNRKLTTFLQANGQSLAPQQSWFLSVGALQNGIFGNGVIAVPSVTSLRTTNSFLPLNEQSARLGMNILNTAYSLLWLRQDMSPFTTPEYTLAPFEVSQTVNVASSNQTLSSETVLYGTDLICRPPSQVLITKTLGLTFDDGQGCVAQDLLPISDGDGDGDGAFLGRFAAYYIGYYDNANVDWDLQLAGCPIQASHEILVVWKLASNTAPPDFRNSSNTTALFCTPNYYSRSVHATVSLPG